METKLINNQCRVGNAYDGRASGQIAKAPIWACRSVGRSLPWHGRGPEFKSRHVHHSNRFHQLHGGLAHQRSQIQSPSLIARHVHHPNRFHQLHGDLRHEESVLICFLHWLGTSTRNDSRQFCWPFRHKRNTNKRFFCWLGTSTLVET